MRRKEEEEGGEDQEEVSQLNFNGREWNDNPDYRVPSTNNHNDTIKYTGSSPAQILSQSRSRQGDADSPPRLALSTGRVERIARQTGRTEPMSRKRNVHPRSWSGLLRHTNKDVGYYSSRKMYRIKHWNKVTDSHPPLAWARQPPRYISGFPHGQ